ncbi:hypothetical protein [Spiroplasma tabanidicola]|uniref:Uncharacterized protein n=1 Tax=Spiroplasma tabanidicola TaxID=324079 RepID=A0A6I6CBV8_9MOLU|nr:hypothetical protein [Spiroplasma tabanidicola]QGS52455.1 hypothetical protein STABA_v1c11080 [Spiroplasma tabanidicola]
MKKLLSILSSLALVCQGATIVDACKKKQAASAGNRSENKDQLQKIQDQTMYEEKTKIVVVRAKELINDAQVSAVSSDENLLTASITNYNKEKGFFEVELLAKKEGQAKVTVKYDKTELSFNVNVLKRKSNEPNYENIENLKLHKSSTSPFFVNFSHPVKGSKYEIIAVDKSLVELDRNTGTDENGTGEIEFLIKCIEKGTTKLLINYENVQSVINLEIEEKDDQPNFEYIQDEVVVVKKTIHKKIVVHNPNDSTLKASIGDQSGITVTVGSENVVDGDNFKMYDLEIKGGDNATGDITVTLSYGTINAHFKVKVQNEPKLSVVGQPIVHEGSYKEFELNVENRIQYAQIDVEVINKNNIDAFSMNDFDLDTTKSLKIIVYGLSKTEEECTINITYHKEYKTQIKVKVEAKKQDPPAISGVNEGETINLSKMQGRAISIYIENPISTEMLTTDFDNNLNKDKLKVTIQGVKGDSHYTVFLISDKATFSGSDALTVTLKYSSASDLSFKVEVE